MDNTEIKILELPKILDRRGNLSFVEQLKHIPFEIKRSYWIYDVPGGAERGGHAYRKNDEFMIALSGSFDVVLNDGKEEKITLSFDQWNTLEIGQTLTFKVSIFGNGQIMEEDLSSNAQVFFFFILSCLFFYLLNPILIPIFFDCIEYIFTIKLHFSYFTLKIL